MSGPQIRSHHSPSLVRAFLTSYDYSCGVNAGMAWEQIIWDRLPLPLLYQGSSINYDLCYIMDCDTSSDPSYILLYINKGARLLICTCTHSLFNSSLKPVTKCKSSFTPTNVYKGLQYHVITSTHIIICPIMRGTGTFFIDKICVRATTVKVPIRRNKFVLILAPEAQFNWWSQALQTWQGHNSIALEAS